MNKVDWSLAPDGATKYNLTNGYYSKGDRPDLMIYMDGEWTDSVLMQKNENFVYRPATWSGPQDGLPPVGLRVDYMGDHCTVVAHVNERGQKGAILQGDEDWFYGTEITIDPIKTPEQLAAEQRETAIREIMDIADVGCRVTAARLVDAGFKREVV